MALHSDSLGHVMDILLSWSSIELQLFLKQLAIVKLGNSEYVSYFHRLAEHSKLIEFTLVFRTDAPLFSPQSSRIYSRRHQR